MKRGVLGVLICLILVFAFSFIILPKTGFAIQSLDKNSLESLKLSAGVECLQNSQCQTGFQCVENACVENKDIDLCKSVSLSTPTRQIKEGDAINSIKEVLTKADLPYLLPSGELAENVDGKIIEYFYTPVILISDDKIEKVSQDYQISSDEPIYTYKIFFSKPVDFSDKNLQGQTLKILGEEYVIESSSDNSAIELTSTKKAITIREGNNIKIAKDENGNVNFIEIGISSQSPLKSSEANADSVFNSAKLSFNSIDSNGNVDIKFGGNCE